MKKILIYILLFKSGISMAQFQDNYRTAPPLPKPVSEDSLLKIISKYPTDPTVLYTIDFSLRQKVYSDTVKHALLGLLKKHEWTDAEIKPKVDIGFKENFEYIYFQNILDSSISKSRSLYFDQFSRILEQSRTDSSISFSKEYQKIYDSVYKIYYDSFSTVFKKEYEKKMRSQKITIDPGLVICIAIAQVKEAIPIFKAALSDTSGYFHKRSVEGALAILGDSFYQQKLFDRHNELIKKEFWTSGDAGADIYGMFEINTQKSIGLLADWLDTTRRYDQYREGLGESESPNSPTYYFASLIVPKLLRLLKDSVSQAAFMKLPENKNELRDPHYFMYFNVSLEQILFMKQWMKDNKGKYQLE